MFSSNRNDTKINAEQENLLNFTKKSIPIKFFFKRQTKLIFLDSNDSVHHFFYN